VFEDESLLNSRPVLRIGSVDAHLRSGVARRVHSQQRYLERSDCAQH
jgi:hypothetical protein